MQQNNTPTKTGLLELLRGSQGTQFVIPAYQRNYTWTAGKEVKQLLDDIKIVLSGERNKHFIGIMIYLETSISPYQRECSVIDGQQRLTTIFLILYAIKEFMLEKGMDREAEALEYQFLVNPFIETSKYKLKPLVSDDAVYQQIVSRDFDNIREKKSNVYLNFCYIKNTLKELLVTYTINNILDTMNKLYIVCVPIGMDDYPQKIFESINATGAKLTASDLIRNFILMPIRSDLQDMYYENYWKRLEQLIDNDSKKLEAFFRFFIMAKRLSIINKSAVYRAFTEWYDENVANYGEEGIFKEIVNYASYYYDIYKAPVKSLDPILHKVIEEFRFILSDMPAPLLMELYAIHKSADNKNGSRISAKQLAEIITILNSYLMRRSLCGMDTSDITRYFPMLLKETLTDCNGNYTDIVEIFKKNLVNRNKGNSQEMPDDNRLRDRIQHANMYNLRMWLCIFFRKLESENNPAPVDFSKLNIEHLMPQTATPIWYEALNTDKDTYDENIHRLGNLTLAAKSDNSKMSNKVWEYKNKVLASTNHLKINHEILLKDHWTLKDIEIRTRQLISDIARLYPYYEAKVSTVNRIAIHIDYQNAYAQGYYYPDNGSVEVLSGSTLYTDFPTPESYPDVEASRSDLKDNGVLVENNGQLKFVTNYFFYPKRVKATALSTSAMIILHGSRNGWDYWLNGDGVSIGQIEELRKNKE
ncbi:MAG: DUF262 domain-containing protein [Parabacteroides sp.]|nr:DUF262 domain-containing protein [Parabacteroides sp.]